MSDQEQLQELIANNSQGILAAVTRAGYPHLTNVLYVWDAADRMARVSTTARSGEGSDLAARSARSVARTRSSFLVVCGRGVRRGGVERCYRAR